MARLVIDPRDRLSYGYFDEAGEFHRLGRFPTQAEAIRRMNENQDWYHVNFDNDRQRVQYENIVGKPPGSRQEWDEQTAYSGHGSHEPYKQGSDGKTIVGRKLVRGAWRVVYGSLAMPDGEKFPDAKFPGYMWAWPESKEPDGMIECVKRYRPKGFRSVNDQELAEALAAAARAFQRKMEYDMFSGSAPG